MSAGGQYTSLCPCWTFNLTCLVSAAHDMFINPGMDGMWRRTRGRHFTCCLRTAHALQKTLSPVDSVTEIFSNKDVAFDACRLVWVHVIGFYVQIVICLFFSIPPNAPVHHARFIKRKRAIPGKSRDLLSHQVRMRDACAVNAQERSHLRLQPHWPSRRHESIWLSTPDASPSVGPVRAWGVWTCWIWPRRPAWHHRWAVRPMSNMDLTSGAFEHWPTLLVLDLGACQMRTNVETLFTLRGRRAEGETWQPL